METVTMHIKIDSTLYDDAKAVLGFLGMSIEDAIVIFLQQVASTGKIPFDYNTQAITNAEEKVSVFEDIKTGLEQAIEHESSLKGETEI